MFHNLTQSNLNTLQKLNHKLKSLEKKLLKEAITLDEVLLKRVEDKEDLLHDYEINLIISFYLKEDDVHYDENEDNILVTLREYLKNISIDEKKNPWRWSANHNEFRGQTDHLMKGENHCWLYHSLYDHTHLSFEDLLRIGTIWSDIEVCYQYVDTVDGN